MCPKGVSWFYIFLVNYIKHWLISYIRCNKKTNRAKYLYNTFYTYSRWCNLSLEYRKQTIYFSYIPYTNIICTACIRSHVNTKFQALSNITRQWYYCANPTNFIIKGGILTLCFKSFLNLLNIDLYVNNIKHSRHSIA